MTGELPKVLTDWYASRGWTVFDFQHRAWEAYRDGRDGLIFSPTGTGKTFAAWLGPVLERLAEGPADDLPDPIRAVWITPLRALANDTAMALQESADALGLRLHAGCGKRKGLGQKGHGRYLLIVVRTMSRTVL